MRQSATPKERLRKSIQEIACLRAQVVFVASVVMLLLTLTFLHEFTRMFDYSLNENIDDWFGWAKVAWRYFQPGIGVNPVTGLHYGAKGWHRFTDWDLAAYVSAIINAERLELISKDGPWGSNYRLEKILNFLETRPITGDQLPYAQYDADTSGVPIDIGNRTAHPSDSARLLLVLDDLRNSRPDLASRIESIITRYDFELFCQSDYFSANDIYPFYAAQGYWAFGFSTPKLRGLEALGNGNTVDVCGEKLPKAQVTSEPLVLAILENRTCELYKMYADSVFFAQQKRYEQTGKLTAFSEGMYQAPYYYVFEWVVTDEGKIWTIRAGEDVNGPEVVYTKMAFAFHAIYGNYYTRTLVERALSLVSMDGFLEGIMEDGKTVATVSDKTNGMILQAARYSISMSAVADLTSGSVFPRYAITTFVVSHELIDLQLQLLGAVGAHDFTLIYKENELNQVRSIYNAFRNYSDCIIPELSFMQTLEPSDRERVVEATFETFKSVSGRYPPGIFSFQL
ncbi:MAG: DUF3131 domain-containing protein, partial [Candidatus Bathyarchaeia archaeon]